MSFRCSFPEPSPGQAPGSDFPRPPWTNYVALGVCGTFPSLHSLVCQAEILAVTVPPRPAQLGQGLRETEAGLGAPRGVPASSPTHD